MKSIYDVYREIEQIGPVSISIPAEMLADLIWAADQARILTDSLLNNNGQPRNPKAFNYCLGQAKTDHDKALTWLIEHLPEVQP